jgi:hypothetical protein
VTDGDETPPAAAQRRARRGDPPAHLAKVATAGMSGVFVFGLVAVMGCSQRPADEPVVLPPTTTATTSTLVPLASTVPPSSAVPAPPPPPAPVVVATTAAPPPPVVVVSEQSQ